MAGTTLTPAGRSKTSKGTARNRPALSGCWSAHGRIWERYGNRSPFKAAAPHGAYPCEGDDRWLALSCFDEAEWQALVAVAGQREWLDDARFATLAQRLANQDALDTAIGAWSTGQERYDLMARLQAAGVPAGVCQNMQDRYETDPQLAHLEWLTELSGTEIGSWPVAEVPVKMSETPPHMGGPIGRGAPCYGEDNAYVYGELLGMSTDDMETLRKEGVI